VDAFRLLGWRRKPSAVSQGSWDPDWKREIVASLTGVPELGWVLATRVHGKGYATDAVRGDCTGARKYRGGSTHVAGTVCITHPEHKRSIRGADKCGFKAVQQRTYKGSQRFCLRGGSWVQVGLKSHAYSDPFGATDFKVCRRQPSRQAAGRVESPLNTYRKRGVGGAAKPGHSKSKSPAADMRNGRDGGTNHSETGAY